MNTVLKTQIEAILCSMEIPKSISLIRDFVQENPGQGILVELRSGLSTETIVVYNLYPSLPKDRSLVTYYVDTSNEVDQHALLEHKMHMVNGLTKLDPKSIISINGINLE